MANGRVVDGTKMPAYIERTVNKEEGKRSSLELALLSAYESKYGAANLGKVGLAGKLKNDLPIKGGKKKIKKV